jgi:prepilin-type N-terminal cleavage/methylation domain-containing protein
MRFPRSKKGFTLLEILITVSIILVLLAALAINVQPIEQLAKARNRTRETHTSGIALAIERYMYENNGNAPAGIETTAKQICQTSCVTSNTQIDLSILQDYLPDGVLPVDPLKDDGIFTGYTVRLAEVNRVYVESLFAENNESIGFGQTEIPNRPFEVRDLRNLQLWLRADKGVIADDSGRVSLWQDQTTNQLEGQQPFATQMPLLVPNAVNSQPIVRFDGVDDFLQVIGVDLQNTSQVSIIIVSRSLSNQNPQAQAQGGGFAQVYFEENDSFGSVWLSAHQSKITWKFGIGVSDPEQPSVYTRPSSVGTNFRSTILVRDIRSETLFDNGTQVSQFIADADYIEGSRQSMLLGKSPTPASSFHGDIAEVIITKSALSETERLNLNAYLNTKYGL